MEIAKLLPFKRVEHRAILFYRYLNYFVSCFLIDLNGIILSAISQRKRLEFCFQISKWFPCWNTPLLLWLLSSPPFRSFPVLLSFFVFFLFSVSALSSSQIISPWLQVFQSFPISRSNSSRQASKPSAVAKALTERRMWHLKAYRKWRECSPGCFARLPSTLLSSRDVLLPLSLSLFASVALKTTELRSDSNEVSFVVPSWQMADA